MTPTIDLPADLNAEDDEGLNWALLQRAPDRDKITPGAVLVAGTPLFWAVIRVEKIDDDGQVHFTQLEQSDPLAARVLASAR